MRAREQRLSKELQFHVDQLTDQYIEAGMAPAAARRRAQIEFGGLEQIKEQCRDERSTRYLDEIRQDLHHGLRNLRRNPAFAALFVLVLALGSGANTAVFSVVNAVLLQPLPYSDSAELVRLFQTRNSDRRSTVSPLNYIDFRDANRSLEGVAAYQNWTFETVAEGRVHEIPSARVSANLFQVLKVMPALGRPFSAEEDSPGGAPVVVVSHDFWKEKFGADPNVAGKSVRLGDRSFTVVGVMPAGFWFPSRQAELWTPLRLGDSSHRMKRTENYLNVIGRLRDGVSIHHARRDFDQLVAQLASREPASNAGVGAALVPLNDILFENARPALLFLWSAVLLVLLVACGNMALLQLARTSARTREFAMRSALGASRFRLARQSFTETAILTFAGCLAGLSVAAWAISALRTWIPATLPRREDISIDWNVLAFALVVAGITAFLVGCVPVLLNRKADLQAVLNQNRSTFAPGTSLARNSLVIGQVALACVLLLGAGLLARSLKNVIDIDPGFDRRNLLAMRVSAPQQDGERIPLHFQELRSRVAAVPGVEAVSFVSFSPLSGESSGTRFTINSKPLPEPQSVPTAGYRVVTTGYFGTMRTRLLQGRDFSSADTARSETVYIINESMARAFWPNANPIGDRIRRGGVDSTRRWGTIVGVVQDVRQENLEEVIKPEIYIPHAQFAWPELTMVVRTSLEPLNLVPAIQSAVTAHHGGNRVRNVQTMLDLVSSNMRHRRFTAGLLLGFAILALLLAASGIYGVISYAVALRKQEFGIRLALGATRGNIQRLVISQLLRLLSVGLVLGVICSFFASKALEKQLFGVEPQDVATYAAVMLLVAFAGLLATWIPARRATATNPTEAMRQA